MASDCPVCGADVHTEVVRTEAAPALSNAIHETVEGARAAPRAPIRLLFCRSCGHLFNAAFREALAVYEQGYENALHFSSRFRRYADDLADELGSRHALSGATVVEVGSGSGEFLSAICLRSGARGVGFDPSQARTGDPETSVRIVPEAYSESYRELRPALVCCRHCLEHVEDPLAFLREIRTALGEESAAAVYFEVPNGIYMLREASVWDVIHEHCGYFTSGSLRLALERCGFRVDEVHEGFGGQFLCLHGAVDGVSDEVARREAADPELNDLVRAFGAAHAAKQRQWGARLAELRASGKRTVLWGAGSKGTMFLNSVHGSESIDYVIDVNPRKRGHYVAGTGHRIESPEHLREEPVDTVIVMNPIYRQEIVCALKELDVDAEVAAA